jgi:ATP/ADP translocase
MDNNTLIAIIFVSGTLVILMLRLIINKCMFNFSGAQNPLAESFDSNYALSINSGLTFAMFLLILTYDSCTKDLEAKYKQEYKIKYDNFEEYIKQERAKGKEDALEEIKINLMKTQTNIK